MLPNAQEMLQMCSFDASKSTKGASKLRRDLINAEIANLRDLLPLPSSTRQRLSQLQLMALVCVYVRKANYFQQVFRKCDPGDMGAAPNFGFSKAMSGFLMMMTQNGKLLYISDNAAEYLGHSMEDLLIHGDSVYDIIDKQDHQAAQSELMRGSVSPTEEERIFLCRMNVSRNARRQMRFGDQKVVLIQGHFLSFLPLCSRNEPVFLATCTPVAMPETRECVVQGSTAIFTSIHSMDMKFIHLDKNGEFYLGYTKEILQGTSWYQLIHWDNIKEAQTKHRMITQADQDRACILLLRLQTQSGAWIWVHVVLQVKENMEGSQHPVIVCTNQVLGEKEANVMRANSWLYHYYTVQSKLQYSLALESHAAASARMPAHYYSTMMPYPHVPPPDASVHSQLLHHPPHPHAPPPHPHHHHHHHHHHHPHHHHHHHHQSEAPSSHNGSHHHQLSPTATVPPQYSFPSTLGGSYHHQAASTTVTSPTSSPGGGGSYLRLTSFSTWPSDLQNDHADDRGVPTTPSVQGVVQVVPTSSETRHGNPKYGQKTRQLNAAVTAELEGSDDDIVTSPTHSEPQTVPDLGAAVVTRGTAERLGRQKHPCRDLHLVAHHGHQLCVVHQSDAGCGGGGGGGGLEMEHFVPEFSRRHVDDMEDIAWTQNYLASNAFLDTGSENRVPSPTRSEWTVPHTSERWLGPSSPSWPSPPGAARDTVRPSKKMTTTRCKRRRVTRSPSPVQHAVAICDVPVAESRTTSTTSLSSSQNFNQRRWNGLGDGSGHHPCSCNVNTCSPLCLCLKLYDAGLKSKSGAWTTTTFDDWKYYCCSMTATSLRTCGGGGGSASSSAMAVTPFSTPVPSASSLPKPLPLIVRRANSEDDPATAPRWLPAPNSPENTGELLSVTSTVTSALVASTFMLDDMINNNRSSHDQTITERSTEWTMNCGPQRDHLEEPRPS